MWEKIADSSVTADHVLVSHRLKVPGGWIVRTIVSRYNAGASTSQIFVPDPNHEWKLEDTPASSA